MPSQISSAVGFTSASVSSQSSPFSTQLGVAADDLLMGRVSITVLVRIHRGGKRLIDLAIAVIIDGVGSSRRPG